MSNLQPVLGGIEVLTSIASTAHSLIGSSDIVKCFVEDDGHHLFVNCVAEILENLDVEHPVGQILNEAIQAHHKSYHSCTKTLLVMLGFWAREAKVLQEQGIPVWAITEFLEEGLEYCVEKLKEKTVSLSLGSDCSNTYVDIKEMTRESNIERKKCVDEEESKSEEPWNETEKTPILSNTHNIAAAAATTTYDDDDDGDDELSWYFADGKVPDAPSIDTETVELMQKTADVLDDIADTQASDSIPGSLSHISVDFTSNVNPIQGTQKLEESFETKDTKTVIMNQKSEIMENSEHLLSVSNIGNHNCEDFDSEFDDCFDGIDYKETLNDRNSDKSSLTESQTKTSLVGLIEDEFDSCFEGIAYSTKSDIEIKVPVTGTMKQTLNQKEITSFENDGTELGRSTTDCPSEDPILKAARSNGFDSSKTDAVPLNDNFHVSDQHSTKNLDNLEALISQKLKEKKPTHGVIQNNSRHFKTIQCSVKYNQSLKESEMDAQKIKYQNVNATTCLKTSNCSQDIEDKLADLMAKKSKEKIKIVEFNSRHFKTIQDAVQYNTEQHIKRYSKDSYFHMTQKSPLPKRIEQSQNDDDDSKEMECTISKDEDFQEIEFATLPEMDPSFISRTLKCFRDGEEMDSQGKTEENMSTLKQWDNKTLEDVLREKMEKQTKATILGSMNKSRYFIQRNKSTENEEIVEKQKTAEQLSLETGTTDFLGKKHNVVENYNSEVTSQSNIGVREQDSSIYTLAQLASGLSHGADNMMAFAVTMATHQMSGTKHLQNSINVDHIHSCAIPGPPFCKSTVVEGLVVMVTEEQMKVLSQLLETPKRTLIVGGDISPSFRHLGYNESVKGQTILSAEEYTSDGGNTTWLDRVVNIMQELNISLLLAKGAIDQLILDWCLSRDVVAIGNLPSRVIQALSASCEVDCVAYILDASEDDVTEDITLFPWKPDWMDQLTKTSSGCYACISVRNAETQTLVLCHSCPSVSHLCEENFWHRVYRLRNAVEDCCVLPGGGVVEEECFEWLREHADNTRKQSKCDITDTDSSIFKPIVFEALAQGFVTFLQTLQRNNPSNCYKENIHRHEESLEDAVGNTIDIAKQYSDCDNLPDCDSSYHCVAQCVTDASEEQSIMDCNKRKVLYDNYTAKIESWRTAVYLVSLILQCDMHVITGVDETITNKMPNYLGHL